MCDVSKGQAGAIDRVQKILADHFGAYSDEPSLPPSMARSLARECVAAVLDEISQALSDIEMAAATPPGGTPVA